MVTALAYFLAGMAVGFFGYRLALRWAKNRHARIGREVAAYLRRQGQRWPNAKEVGWRAVAEGRKPPEERN